MGWNWDHDRTGYDGDRGGRSYSSHAELGEELRRVVDGQEWTYLAVLFNRGSGDRFRVPPAMAGRIADALTNAAPLVTPAWAGPVRDLAAAARSAHGAGAVWHWS